MAVITPAIGLQDGSHSAQAFRQLLSAVAGAPVQTFAGGIGVTTGGGAHGVVGGGDLGVSEKSGTPDMKVDVAAGLAIITGSSTLAQGAYAFTNDATVTLDVATADGSNPRDDLVVAQIRDDDEDAGGDNDARLFVVTGTPAASPSDPAVPAGCLVLARVRVGTSASSITNANITDLRTFTSAGVQPVTSSTRPTGAALYANRLIQESGKLRRYTGSAWSTIGRLASAFSIATTVAIPNATNTAIIWSTGLLNVAWRDAGDQSRIVVPEAGTYMVSCSTTYDSVTAGTRLRSILKKNGTAFSTAEHLSATAASIQVVGVVNCAASDYIQVDAFHTHGSTRNANSNTNVSVVRID